jgi:peptidoglycan/xylan/chitin deacetylase (PgdA/CDA1 family)
MRVALTFDAEHPDRPRSDPGAAVRIVEALDEAAVRATFFLQGRWAQAHPEEAGAIAGAGHLIGSHSHFHARMPLLTDEGLRADIVQAGRTIREAAGADPKPWFRCPWGHGARDPRVVMALRRQGYGHVGWDVIGEDWEPDRPADLVAREVFAATRAFGDGAVVLLHTWPASAPEALPEIVTGLRAEGATFVTVEALSHRDLGQTADPPVAAENPG